MLLYVRQRSAKVNDEPEQSIIYLVYLRKENTPVRLMRIKNENPVDA